MATFVFENMTQAQADNITATDIVAFATATTNARNVGVAISTQVGTGVITLTSGGKALGFNSATLATISTSGNIVFNDNSRLDLGTNGDETVTGSTQPNTVYLFAGNDSYNAGATDSEDFVYGMGGNDTITGGSTASHLYGFNASGGTDGNDIITGGESGDYLQGNSGTDTLDGGTGSDRILGGAGNDTISGGTGNDTANGNLGNDSLSGGSDNDLLRGGQGNDVVNGDAGDDTLLGDLGTDTVDGGAGVDFLTGGAGNDQFLFTGAGNTGVGTTVKAYDTINDYVDGEDNIHITANGSIFGDAAASAEINIGASGATFTTVSAATVYAQQLLDANAATNDIALVKVGGDTYIFYESAGTGAGDIDTIIKIQGVTDTSIFTQADFA